MANLVLFHHAQGVTPGCHAFANELRAAGHVVHVPDLYDSRTFATLEEGMAYADEVGFDTIIERGRRAAEGLPNDLVYLGFSLGVLPAQALAQTRPADESLPGYEERAATLLKERVLAFLDGGASARGRAG